MSGSEGVTEEHDASDVKDDESQSEDDNSQAEHDLEALRTTQSEVRDVLDHQIQTFNDVDNKAARTFRLNAILLGLLVTAASFVGQADIVSFDSVINEWTLGGVVLLTTSFITAVLTYTKSNIETGVGPNDVERLIRKRYSEKEWLILLLRSEAEWMRENDRRQTINGVLISASHVALIFGIIALFVGIVVLNWPL